MLADVHVDCHLQLADVAAVHVIVELQTIVGAERQIRNLDPGVCTRLMALSFDVGKLAYRDLYSNYHDQQLHKISRIYAADTLALLDVN